MSGKSHRYPIRSGMTMLCIAVFLFSYVNATMFWHGHSGAGYWVFHSHIASASHRAAPSENPHNAAELLLIEAANQASFTDEVMPACDLEPLRTVLGTVQTQPVRDYLESQSAAYLQGDSSLLDYLMAVRVYNETAEQCIEARSGLAAAAAELIRAIGL